MTNFWLVAIISLYAAISATTVLGEVQIPDAEQEVNCFASDSCQGSSAVSTRGACCNNTEAPVGFSTSATGGGECRRCPIVFGFSRSVFIGEERGQNHVLQVGYQSGRPNAVGIFTLAMTRETTRESDVTLVNTQIRVFPSSPLFSINLGLHVDGVAQEVDETFTLRITNIDQTNSNLFPEEPFAVLDVLTGIIRDTDRIVFELSEMDYRALEQDLVMEVKISKDQSITLANPVTFMITPLTIDQAREELGIVFPIDPATDSVSPVRADEKDFNTTAFEVVFPADENMTSSIADVDAFISIVDDDIDEADDQFFIAYLERVNATNSELAILERVVSTCIIVDNDPIRIGYARQNYTFNEPPFERLYSNVTLIREGGRQSEQTFLVAISITDPSTIRPAILGTDFRITNPGDFIELDFIPTVESITLGLFINGDELPEGTEGFRASSTPSERSPPFQAPQTNMVFQSTEIRIIDDDLAIVGFQQPSYTVNENDGFQEVCVEVFNPPSNEELLFGIILEYETASGSADGSDFTRTVGLNILQDASRTFCFFVPITDDDLPEDVESFTVILRPEAEQSGVIVRPNVTEIFIQDSDVAVVGFQQPNYTVNENDGFQEVCVEVFNPPLNEELFFDITLDYETASGSADGSDFTRTVGLNVLQDESRTFCFIVPITDDSLPEDVESFTVILRPEAQQSRVIVRPNVTEIFIQDNDVSECTITEPLMVSPFGDENEYSFTGTCELIALMSCNGTEPGFAVRVDFLGDSESNGAVGVFLGDLKWISREDGSFSSDIEPATSGTVNNILEWPAHNIQVTTNEVESRREIEVGGAIQVTVTHEYGENKSISLSVEQGSSLLETCGICGTQSGELLSLSGEIATTRPDRGAFVESYRVPITNMSLRPLRQECDLDNETVNGDPLFTCPISSDLNLCYEVHGRANTYFNFVSDKCVHVNALYSSIAGLNIISSIGVRAEGNNGTCHFIRVDLNSCTLSTGTSEDTMVSTKDYSMSGVSARKTRGNRVRISVPNCEGHDLVMWVVCESRPLEMITFRILRGGNLNPTSHGLLGQFWNIRILVEPFTPPNRRGNNWRNVTVIPADSPPRSFLGFLHAVTWDRTREDCLYVGNSQGGPSGETYLPGSVIEGRYKEYITTSLFDTEFKYKKVEGECGA